MKVATKLARVFGGLKVRYKLMILHNLFFLLLSALVYVALMPAVEQWAAEVRARGAIVSSQASSGEAGDETLYEPVVRRARVNLFVALVVSYWLGVLILEGVVMRSYIYAPLKAMLDAEEAARRGDAERELIDDSIILGDELGRLMSSRNATLRELRRHERELEAIAADLRKKNNLLETAKRNIADQDRLASLGLLMAAVAHELNTPLTVLQGSVEQLLETVGDEEAQTRLKRMRRVTQRLRKISEGMLDYSRVRKQDTEAVAVSALVEEAWAMVSIDEKARRVSFLNTVEDSVWVTANAARLNQLLLNLLRNALEAAPEGGEVAVSAVPSGEKIMIRIDDDGPGIPEDLLPDVFEAFITTRLDSRGTGLGLTVAEGIAHEHGGSIAASNRPGGGARLEVLLPASGKSCSTEARV